MTAGLQEVEFQVAGTVQHKDHLPMLLCLNGTSRKWNNRWPQWRECWCVPWCADWDTPL